jgi:metal-responsive CopG/Arc/MetJ family transcriptional regulator
MSSTDTDEDGEPEKTNINIRITEAFLEDVDATWQAEGFNSRSEFIRFVLRDAVKHPSFTRETWKEIAAEEYRERTGEAETYSSEEVKTLVEDDG